MNRNVIAAIVRRDLMAVSRNAGVMAPMIIVPVVFVIVLPLAAWGVSNADVGMPVFQRILDLLPASMFADLPGDDALRVGLVLATFVFPILLVVVPLLVASVMATDAIAGERERDTLEGLLLAPASDREILVGKLLGAMIPALAMGLLAAALYAVAVNLLLGPAAGGLVLPTWTWSLIVLWFGPAFAAAGLGFTLLVSARAKSVQAATQVSGVAVLPLIAMTIGQVAGLVLVQWWVAALLGGILWAVAAWLVVRSAHALRREQQVVSLG